MNDPIDFIENIEVDFKPAKETIITIKNCDDDRLKKLAKIKQSILQQEKKKRSNKKPTKTDYYSEKLLRFLTSSFILNLVLEPFFLYEMTYDYIVSYFELGQHLQQYETFYPKTTLPLVFYFFKIWGLIAGHFILKKIKENQTVTQKVFSVLIILISFSLFVSKFFLRMKSWKLFILFYCGFPGLLTGPITLFYLMNIAKLCKKKQMSYQLIFSYPGFSHHFNYFIIPLISTLSCNYNNYRPTLVNTQGGQLSLLQPLYLKLDSTFVTGLNFAPIYVIAVGFFGLLVLYGLDWRAKEVPTDEIQWDQFQKNKIVSKLSLNKIKLNEVIEYIEEDNKGNSDEYTFVSFYSGSDIGSPMLQRISSDKIRNPLAILPRKFSSIKNKVSALPSRSSDLLDLQKEVLAQNKQLNNTAQKDLNLRQVLFSMPCICLLLSFTFINTSSCYFCLRSRGQKLTFLFLDLKTVPLMMTEGIMSACFTFITVFVSFFLTKQKKVLFLHSLLSILVLIGLHFLLSYLFGMVFLSVINVYIFVSSQILLTVVIAQTVDYQYISYIYPFVYSSLCLSFVLLYCYDYFHISMDLPFQYIFVGFEVVGLFFLFCFDAKQFKEKVKSFQLHQTMIK